MQKKFSIIGAGAWGTAMGLHLALKDNKVLLWAFEKHIKEMIESQRQNYFLQGYTLESNIDATNEIEEALEFSDYVFWAVPVQYIAGIVEKIDSSRYSGKCFINLSKGLEISRKRFPLEILRENFGENSEYIALAGPSFASEFAAGKPTILVAASDKLNTAKDIQDIIQQRAVRVYTSDDAYGIQLAGAFKNIYAIAAGIADGMELGGNARAALITRALVELTRLATQLNASPETIAGAAGIGDLILTCTSEKSRNYSFGLQIGKGSSPDEIIARTDKAVEGYYSTKAAFEFSKVKMVELPIANILYEVLYENLSPGKALKALLERSPKPEWY
ncbi:MAG: NAD(P)H-dependent glycerol-3-phosphate dehydrogenase [Candidatus Zixiibacteriota bacterium]